MTQLRSWHDKHVASHAAFLPSIFIALFLRDPPLVEMVLALLPVLVLSTLYHRAREPVGTLLTRCEWVSAFSLYAVSFLMQTPDPGQDFVKSGFSSIFAIRINHNFPIFIAKTICGSMA